MIRETIECIRVTALLFFSVTSISSLIAQSGEGVSRWIHPGVEDLSGRSLFSTVGHRFVRLGNGSLLAVVPEGTRISQDEGVTWFPPSPIYNGLGAGVPTDPEAIPIRTRDGVLIVVYRDRLNFKWSWNKKNQEAGDDVRSDVWTVRSLDDGKTWIDRQRIFQGYCGFIMDTIETRSGQVIVPVQTLLRFPSRHGQFTYVTEDQGRTWKQSNLIDLGGHGDHDGGYEGTLEELTDGRILMLLRTNLDFFWEVYSNDNGHYWRTFGPSSIDSSSSPGYLTRLRSGRLVLAWNRLYPKGKVTYRRDVFPRSEVPASAHREELSIAFSEDDARTWTEPVIVARLTHPGQTGAACYPYIFEVQTGKFWLIASHSRPNPPVWISLKEENFVIKKTSEL